MLDSVTQWMLGLQNSTGDERALGELWERYFERIAATARKRMEDMPRRAADEEDVALSVLNSFCRGCANGRFKGLKDRDELWRLLLAITRQKVVDHVRHEMRQKRGGGQVRGESVFGRPIEGNDYAGLEAFANSDLAPDDWVAVEEQVRVLMQKLPENLGSVAQLRLEGYEIREIAEKLDVSISTIERKLRLSYALPFCSFVAVSSALTCVCIGSASASSW